MTCVGVPEEYLFIPLVVLAAIGFGLSYRFLAYLRNNHREVWAELGSPSLIVNNSIRNSLATMSFMWRKEYLRLGDHKLNRMARFNVLFGYSYLAIFVALVLYLFIFEWCPSAKG